MDFTVRKQGADDWPAVWRILQPVFREGLTYPLPRDVGEDAARGYWIKPDGYNGLAIADGDIVALYYLRPDQGGPGDHVCNAGYVIAPNARGRGLAAPLCRQSQTQARALGFRAMVFNLVVANNAPAIRAWKKAGMRVIGVKPAAFRLPDGEMSDAFVMWKAL